MYLACSNNIELWLFSHSGMFCLATGCVKHLGAFKKLSLSNLCLGHRDNGLSASVICVPAIL